MRSGLPASHRRNNPDLYDLTWGYRRHIPPRGWNRDHEHYAVIGDRANARDRYTQSNRGPKKGYHGPVFN
jgi:hypothetical protein